MARFEWICPLTQEKATRPIYVLKCGHSFSGYILNGYSIVATPFPCPLCRADVGLTRSSLQPESLTHNVALETIIDASKDLKLQLKRKIFELENTQTDLAVSQSRYTVAMKRVAELTSSNQDWKRRHEDLSYDVAYNTPALCDWRSLE